MPPFLSLSSGTCLLTPLHDVIKLCCLFTMNTNQTNLAVRIYTVDPKSKPRNPNEKNERGSALVHESSDSPEMYELQKITRQAVGWAAAPKSLQV